MSSISTESCKEISAAVCQFEYKQHIGLGTLTLLEVPDGTVETIFITTNRALPLNSLNEIEGFKLKAAALQQEYSLFSQNLIKEVLLYIKVNRFNR